MVVFCVWMVVCGVRGFCMLSCGFVLIVCCYCRFARVCGVVSGFSLGGFMVLFDLWILVLGFFGWVWGVG